MSLFSMYGPTVATIIFALAQGLLFPESSLWLIPAFFLFILIIFGRYVK